MGSLRHLRDDALFRLEELSEQYSPSWDSDTQLRAWSLYCGALVNAARVALLVDADATAFSLWLARAGANWQILLDRTKDGTPLPLASENHVLLGLLTIGDFAAAARLARSSARNQGPYEYEDEFLHAFLCQEAAAAVDDGRSLDALAPVIAKLAAATDDARPRAWHALVGGDAAGFWAALTAMGHAYTHRMRDLAKDPAADYFEWRAAKDLWLEGLALGRLARRIGLRPSPVPMPGHPPFAVDCPTMADDGAFLLARR